jgi:aspartate racemase
MKKLGVIGGIGPESTIAYYRRILAASRERSPDSAAAPVFINSIDLSRVVRLVTENALSELASYLIEEVEALAKAGSALGIIAANTPHIVFDDIRDRSPIPLVSIVEAACDAVKALGLTRVGLFGTRFTMQGRFYPDVFSRERIEVVPPTAADQAFIHDKYMNELLNNLFAPSTRDRLLNIVHVMHTEQRVQAVILAGTELPLVLTDPAAAAVPLLDTTVIHVDAAIERLNAL